MMVAYVIQQEGQTHAWQRGETVLSASTPDTSIWQEEMVPFINRYKAVTHPGWSDIRATLQMRANVYVCVIVCV